MPDKHKIIIKKVVPGLKCKQKFKKLHLGIANAHISLKMFLPKCKILLRKMYALFNDYSKY